MNTFVYLSTAILVVVSVSQAGNMGHRSKRQDDDVDYDYEEQDADEAALGLVSDAKTIRENIDTESFSCEGRVYGYYADVANDCQIFHVCYPVTYPDGQGEMFHWSFICPNQTIFDQSTLVCSFPLDSLDCEDAPSLYEGPDSINSKFGLVEEPREERDYEDNSREGGDYEEDQRDYEDNKDYDY